ncbi:RNA polymerase sigma-70 factor (ECF subfamily) [Saccharothrix tamanrassetensis]|uniref:RNA polymerase sigma-70 factor (ECF subfamily) n=1 Tax=Saccharothrix tamanrassetensis TaxID=1051531 RepID=A0A841CJJ4_9PSEU|nr:RNA polymerase sigma factor [Saccharothrix tamanrassetensis]MBB5957143.1 RNA polymerase sigma-70 factor (ECF subfamily) [Saccharothrix tamanrassetensis]
MSETTGSGPPVGTDADIWRRIAGDGPDAHAAFTELFQRHAEAVWNYAYRLTASWAQADDLLSTTFLNAWRTRGRAVLARDSARPWLFTVTARLARDQRRAGARLAAVVQRLSRVTPERDHADAVVEHDFTERRLRRVLKAVDRLPRAEREVVRLCLLGEVSTSDAARLLGIAEASVRSRTSRARARLRGLIEEDNDA